MILVGYIQPFDMKQKIFVLDETTKDTVETVYTTLDKYPEEILTLLDIYNVKTLQLHGSEKFCLKTKYAIDEAQILKYNKKKLFIEIK